MVNKDFLFFFNFCEKFIENSASWIIIKNFNCDKK